MQYSVLWCCYVVGLGNKWMVVLGLCGVLQYSGWCYCDVFELANKLDCNVVT